MKQIGILTKWVQLSTLWLTALAILCWVVMFLAGTDKDLQPTAATSMG